MPGAEVANLWAKWVNGALYFYDGSNTEVAILSSTGIDLRGGGNTISTGSFSSDLTISSGRLAYSGQKTVNVTTAKTLTASSCGVVQLVTVSDVVVTLPGAASTGKQLYYTIISTVTTAGQVVIKTTTTELIYGGGVTAATGVDILSNTAATHMDGDFISLINAAVSTSWTVMGMVGTWASTT